MSKSADAFRTISEVADWLGIPAHVLRFWESKFTQVKPVKRAGGRRYYRPADMQLLGGIRKLLHDEGMTIKGVQKIMREQGVRHVAAMSPPLDSDLAGAMEADLESEASGIALDVEQEETERGQVVSFGRPAAGASEAGPDTQDASENEPEPEPEDLPSAASNDTHSEETVPDQQIEADQEVQSAEPEEKAPSTSTEDEARDIVASHDTAEVAAPEPPAPHGESRGAADIAEPPKEADDAPEATAETDGPDRPAPIVVDTPDDPSDDAHAPAPVVSLQDLARTAKPTSDAAAQYAEIAGRLAALRERVGDGRKSS